MSAVGSRSPVPSLSIARPRESSPGQSPPPSSPSPPHWSARRRIGQSGANLVLLGLWLWLYRPVFDYLGVIFSRDDFRVNQWAMALVVALAVWQARAAPPRPRLDAPPRLRWPPLIVAIGGSALYLTVERHLDVNTFAASLFVLASYGLAGLWLRPNRWRAGLPAALLIVGVLPFGEHLQTFVGYPLRILTAAAVRDGLEAVGVASLGVDTILTLENGVAQVDLPCSGVKSLWAGLLFLLAATWVERRPLGPRWLAMALLLTGLLCAANLVRVAILVVVGLVFGALLAAEMLHVPLGVLGFVGACAAAVAGLRSPLATTSSAGPSGQAEPTAATGPVWLTPALAAVVLAMALAYAPRPPTALAEPPAWSLPAGMSTEPLPLEPDQVAWLTRDGAESAERRRFAWRGIQGSLMLVTSATWRAQHLPERCLEVYGLAPDDSRPHLVEPAFPVRLVSLRDRHGGAPLAAAYWFQSPSRATDDYATRIWADLSPRRERWVLVTMLFDGAIDPRGPDARALFLALRDAIGRNLSLRSPSG